MFRRAILLVFLVLLVLSLAGCHNKKVSNPIANLGSKQPDKVLFDKAMDAMRHNRFDTARLTLQTLINTYPDSEYIARAKLAIGDSWYAEGGGAAMTQAEIEYKDFITFFPNMPEAAEAQLKIANIHFNEMEKPDRDFTHAKRAENEYRQLLLQFPDSKLVPQARERLLQVQEVLGEREYRIGRFYFLRESWPAAIARLKSLTDSYPLYSRADDALYMLGTAYEREVDMVRGMKITEAAKGKLVKQFADSAADAYAHIVTRYPVGGRSEDAKKRLQSMNRPVPVPTPAAIALNKAEESSRGETGKVGRVMMNFHRRPDVAQATKVGDPSLADLKPTSAPEIVRSATKTLMEGAAGGNGTQSLAVETIGAGRGAPPASGTAPATPAGITPGQNPSASPGQPSAASSPEQTTIPELKPNQPNSETRTPGAQPEAGTPIPELKPNVPETNAAPAPAQPTATPPAAPSTPQQVPQQVNDAKAESSAEATENKSND